MASNTKTSSPGGFVQKLKALDAGTKKDIPAKSSVTIASSSMTSAQISTQIESYESSYGAVTDARTALKQALAAWAAVEPAARQFVLNYTHALKAQFGANNPILVDFGINPAKPKSSKTAAEKAVSAALAATTKALRGVKGKNQKAAITALGKPGLVLVSPTGQPLASNLPGPTPPGQSAAVDAAGSLAQVPSGSSASGSTGAGNGGGTTAPTAPVGTTAPTVS
ncbi:MAG TPA: hypothetical protein VMB50_04085 [Myxococcales bacterium]|nr:hypothetical protein [Myxococcales bacterium]